MDTIPAFGSSNRKIDPSRRRRPAPGKSRTARPTITIASRSADGAGLRGVGASRARGTQSGGDAPVPARPADGRAQKRDYAGVLCFDPLNIRYVTDSTTCSVGHPQSLARLLRFGRRLCRGLGIRPLRTSARPFAGNPRGAPGADFLLFSFGRPGGGTCGEIRRRDRRSPAHAWRRQPAPRRRSHGSCRLLALRDLGVEIREGQEVTENARLVKGADDIKAMRCAVHSCEPAWRRCRARWRPA